MGGNVRMGLALCVGLVTSQAATVDIRVGLRLFAFRGTSLRVAESERERERERLFDESSSLCKSLRDFSNFGIK